MLHICKSVMRHWCFLLLQVLVLRNHGIVICGSSVEESFHLAFNTMSAVDVQVCTYYVYCLLYIKFNLGFFY